MVIGSSLSSSSSDKPRPHKLRVGAAIFLFYNRLPYANLAHMRTNAAFKVQKVEKRSTEVQAADSLRSAIISGAIPLGSRLTEINCAELLGVSRATIRTAFHQLVQEGLIVQIPYTGWVVMTLSSQDAWELYTLRASLESLAAKLVAARGAGNAKEEIRKNLQRAFGDLKLACNQGSKSDIAVKDLALHKCIVGLSCHGRLIDQYSRIEHQILVYIQSSDGLVGSPQDLIEQHSPLIESLLAGDESQAAEDAIVHNEREGAILVDFLRVSEEADARRAQK